MKIEKICVYCGSSAGRSPEYLAQAAVLGEYLAKNGIELIYGGGAIGLMGKVADSALASGGRVTGVIPKSLESVGHKNLSRLIVVDSMHERKKQMFELADGFIALPGGFGTFEEIFEITTWGQLGFHAKPFGLMNIDGYYDKLIEFLDYSVAEQFIRQEHRNMLLADNDLTALLKAMENYQPANIGKWY